LGEAICRRLAASGRHVYVHANSGADRAERIAADIVAAGGSATAVVFDITDAQATEAVLAGVLAAGAIEILVNNAGIHDDAVMPGMRRDQWSSVIDVSLNGFFNVTQPLLMPMISQRWGRIINISSVTALAGNRGQVNYAAAKAGLHGATRALALELASRGITVNTVAPGIIASLMRQSVRPGADSPVGADETRRHARGGCRPRAVSRVGVGWLYFGADHIDQRRDVLTRRRRANMPGRRVGSTTKSRAYMNTNRRLSRR
jgi:3-oxoacyl-[acyl-carrier protein] reductase